MVKLYNSKKINDLLPNVKEKTNAKQEKSMLKILGGIFQILIIAGNS